MAVLATGVTAAGRTSAGVDLVGGTGGATIGFKPASSSSVSPSSLSEKGCISASSPRSSLGTETGAAATAGFAAGALGVARSSKLARKSSLPAGSNDGAAVRLAKKEAPGINSCGSGGSGAGTTACIGRVAAICSSSSRWRCQANSSQALICGGSITIGGNGSNSARATARSGSIAAAARQCCSPLGRPALRSI